MGDPTRSLEDSSAERAMWTLEIELKDNTSK